MSSTRYGINTEYGTGGYTRRETCRCYLLVHCVAGGGGMLPTSPIRCGNTEPVLGGSQIKYHNLNTTSFATEDRRQKRCLSVESPPIHPTFSEMYLTTRGFLLHFTAEDKKDPSSLRLSSKCRGVPPIRDQVAAPTKSGVVSAVFSHN